MTKTSGKVRLNENSGSRLLGAMVKYSASHKKVPGIVATTLVDLALLRRHAGIKLDFTERAFILADVLLQDGQQRLGLLRA